MRSGRSPKRFGAVRSGISCIPIAEYIKGGRKGAISVAHEKLDVSRAAIQGIELKDGNVGIAIAIEITEVSSEATGEGHVVSGNTSKLPL